VNTSKEWTAEDEALIRMMVGDMLAEMGHTVIEVGDLRTGLALAQAGDFDAAILDLNLESDSAEGCKTSSGTLNDAIYMGCSGWR
jgi:DNA-binding response OmpR family regulator